MEKKIKCPSCENLNVISEQINTSGNCTVSYLCPNCGYISNSQYYINSEYINSLFNSNEIFSEIICNLHIYDPETKLFWFPMVIYKENGIIIPSGNHDSFKWEYIPIISIDNQDEKSDENIKDNKKLAIELKETFSKEEFLVACEKLGHVILKEENNKNE